MLGLKILSDLLLKTNLLSEANVDDCWLDFSENGTQRLVKMLICRNFVEACVISQERQQFNCVVVEFLDAL